MANIELSGVTKRFRVYRKQAGRRRRREVVTAVDALDLSIDSGDVVGYIGPNGAGKSTTVKLLTGILAPTAGTVRVAGLDPQANRVRLAHRIGVVFGQRTQLWWDLPLRESFELLRYIYRTPQREHRPRLADLVDRLDVGPLLEVPVRQLSLGQRMRGEVTAALLHGPDILYLDEPTIGLDVVSKTAVRDFVAALNRDHGVTVLLTTHDLSDVERLCRRLAVIDHGRIVYDGSVTELKARFGPYRTLIVDLETPAPPLTIRGAVVIRVDGARQWLRFDRHTTNATDLVARVAAAARLVDMAIEEPHIDDVVTRIYANTRPATSGKAR